MYDLNNKIEIQKIIGKGSFSCVYKCKIKNKIYALKYIEYSNKSINNILELFILKYFNYKYIINSYDIFIDNLKNINIIQPLAHSNLNIYLKKRKINNLEVNNQILYDISSAIGYLHSLKICHCDIKPSNILIFLDKNNISVKLSDFGLSKFIDNDYGISINSSNLYTKHYRPLEITDDKKLNLKSDIWALGCVFYEVYYSKKLFNDIFTPYNLTTLFYKNSNLIDDILKKMLINDITKRISIFEVLEDKIFSNSIKIQIPKIPKIFTILDNFNILFYKNINLNTSIFDIFNNCEDKVHNSILQITTDYKIINNSFNIFLCALNKIKLLNIDNYDKNYIPIFKNCIILSFKIFSYNIPFKLTLYDINSELILLDILKFNLGIT